ncbi:Tripartite tricarboxylate transporter TctA family protein [compost metagenome]
MDILNNLMHGFSIAFALDNLMWAVFGVFMGNLIGVLPGMGVLAAISILLPLTYTMTPTAALVMLSGIYYGSQYGGGITSIMLNLPGTGPTIASFISYATEKKVAREPRRFGRGAIEGIAGPEAATSASTQTSFIPTMSLGIPGDPVMALMLGALIIHGIQPGPQMMVEHADMFWGLIASFWVGNVLLLLLNLPLIGMWVRLLTVPFRYLFPAALFFVCVGVYSTNNNLFDVAMVTVFGAAGYALIRLRFEPAPLLLGFVLGPMVEENFRRALLLSRGDLSIFVSRPISLGFIAACAGLIALLAVSAVRQRKARGGLSSEPAA